VLLHGELSERAKAQEALEVQGRLLRLSADISAAMTEGLALQAIFERCAGFLVRDLDAALVRIWTLGSEENTLELRASAGLSTRIDGEHRRKVFGKLKIGIIASDQRPMLTNAVVGDANFVDQEWARREGIVAFAGYPLVVEGRTLGVLALFGRHPLAPHTLSALEVVADKLAQFVARTSAEEALRASEKRYRDLFDSSLDGIYTVNADGVFTSMNRAGARIFGHEAPAEIIGRPALEYWRDARDREAFLAKLRAEKSVSAYRISARKRDGVHLELESSSRILQDESGRSLGIEGVLRDVTARGRAEAERELLIAQLQEAAASIKTLSGLLPICAGCKKIRDDEGSWSQIEVFVSSRTSAEFSHGLCPDCMKAYFPGTKAAGAGG
jgi:PAS domain S-box-containing protein